MYICIYVCVYRERERCTHTNYTNKQLAGSGGVPPPPHPDYYTIVIIMFIIIIMMSST